MEVTVKRHQVQCKIEDETESVVDGIRAEINNLYMKSVANTLRKSNLSKVEQIYILEQILEGLKNCKSYTKI